MRRTLLAGVLLVLSCAVIAHGQVTVSIVSMPREVYEFDPVYVLFEVANRGSEPVYLPASQGIPFWGFTLEVAVAGEEPRPISTSTGDWPTPFPTGTMWLAPSEKWLFYQNIGPGVTRFQGEVLVQAVLSSMGRCGDEQIYGRRSFPLEPLRIDTFQPSPTGRSWAVYRCWEGEVSSKAWSVTVRESADPLDQDAKHFVKESSGDPRLDDESVRASKTWPRGLDLLFPQSRYTFGYLTRAGSNVHARILALELQPNHPLAPWVRGAIAKRVLDFQSSCWDQKKWPFDRSGKELPTFDASLLPEGVPEFLEQYRWYLEHRYCPRALEGAGDASFPRTWGEASARPPQQLGGEQNETPTEPEGNPCVRNRMTLSVAARGAEGRQASALR